jgi:cytochrome c-type biogenesis protein CcmE
MKARHKRLIAIVGGVVGLTVASLFILNAFRSNLVFFYTPTEILEGKVTQTTDFRMGGLVENGSVHRGKDGLSVDFVVTDLNKSITVHYKGILPDLFREGKGVVTQGKLDGTNKFIASQVLAKHDENYMPPEVAASLHKPAESLVDDGVKDKGAAVQ